jgi:surface antigen
MTLRLAPLAAILLLSGCAPGGLGGGSTLNNGPKTASAAIVQAMNGGLVGGQIGADLSPADRGKALEAEYRALEYTQTGQVVAWKSASGTTTGEVTAAAPYRVGSQDCRQYTHVVTSPMGTRSARGTACRNPDGSWTPLT